MHFVADSIRVDSSPPGVPPCPPHPPPPSPQIADFADKLREAEIERGSLEGEIQVRQELGEEAGEERREAGEESTRI